MKRTTQIALFLSPVFIGSLLYGLFQFTDPLSVGPGGVLGVFVLIYLGCLSMLFILLRFGVYWMRKFLARRVTTGHDIKFSSVETRKAYYIASVLAFVPVVFLAMHAYSQLQFTDIALVGILMTIVTFYIIKRR